MLNNFPSIIIAGRSSAPHFTSLNGFPFKYSNSDTSIGCEISGIGQLPLTGLRLPQAAFRDLVPGRSYHASTGVVTGTRAACGKSMLAAGLLPVRS